MNRVQGTGCREPGKLRVQGAGCWVTTHSMRSPHPVRRTPHPGMEARP